eukprot:m.13068 g.13068  ORF g.13068 m.13068 type:complete len:377 (+) comp9582_c0_seq1:308-1438(+)
MKILILGGNGMLGGDTVFRLAQDGHQITTINRGNQHWDNSARLKDCVFRQVRCDRNKLIRDRRPKKWPDEVMRNETFDYLIDFSSFKREDVASAVKAFGTKIQTYIFISSDSVYEVCRSDEPGFRQGVTKSVESDARRPESKSEQKILRRFDRYGHRKLAAEEEITEAASTKFNFLHLRLADVIGERDGTDRWLRYMLWIYACDVHGKAIDLPSGTEAGQQLSFVFSDDVAKVIAHVVKNAQDMPAALNQAYNLAFTSSATLNTTLEMMAKAMAVRTLRFNTPANPEMYFPSVTRGPVDVSKAKQRLQWQPQPLQTTIKRICTFYVKALLEANKNTFDAIEEIIADQFKDNTNMTKESFLRSIHIKLTQSLAHLVA